MAANRACIVDRYYEPTSASAPCFPDSRPAEIHPSRSYDRRVGETRNRTLALTGAPAPERQLRTLISARLNVPKPGARKRQKHRQREFFVKIAPSNLPIQNGATLLRTYYEGGVGALSLEADRRGYDLGSGIRLLPIGPAAGRTTTPNTRNALSRRAPSLLRYLKRSGTKRRKKIRTAITGAVAFFAVWVARASIKKAARVPPAMCSTDNHLARTAGTIGRCR
jgi:hypothetical protein